MLYIRIYEIVQFEAALEKTSVTDLMEMVWKTVPCSRSSMREASLSELGSAPRLGVDSCVGGSETRSTAGTRDSLNAIREILWRTLSMHEVHYKTVCK